MLSANKDESTKGKDGGAAPYTLQDLGGGVFALINGPALHCSSSQSYNIVGWGADAEASQWTITAVALDEALEARTKLEELVGKAEALINEVGTVEEQGVEPITLTADAYYCNARCINTQWDKFSSYSVLNDGDIDTYLHTDYSGEDSEDGYAHYIRMDVGESNNVQMFKINYTTRNYTYPTAPTSITVEGRNDLTTWEPIETNFTEGLPTNQGTAFTTPAFGNGIKYRYIRLVVNSTSTNKEAGPEGNKHRYFALSELGISKVNYTTALNATYNTINSNLLSDLYSGMLEANGTLATSSQADVLNAAYTTLYTTYKALLDAKAGVDNTALTAKKATLEAGLTPVIKPIRGGTDGAEATYNGLKKHDKRRPFVITRACYSGVQKYSTVWTGDNQSIWPHLEMAIPQLCNMGMSGLVFSGTDIGGFGTNTHKELLIRWLEASVFTPLFRNHCEVGSIHQEPWCFDKETIDIYRKFVNLRYEFIPYIYDLFFEQLINGLPILRPLVMEYQNDKNTFELNDEFMVGENILVAPIVKQGASKRMVYLPKGEWVDYFTNKIYQGNQYIIVNAPLDALPLFIKNNSLIVKYPLKQFIEESDTLIINVYGNNGSYVHYQDDGESFNYENGEFNLYYIENNNNQLSISLDNHGYNRTYNFIKIIKASKDRQDANIKLQESFLLFPLPQCHRLPRINRYLHQMYRKNAANVDLT